MKGNSKQRLARCFKKIEEARKEKEGIEETEVEKVRDWKVSIYE